MLSNNTAHTDNTNNESSQQNENIFCFVYLYKIILSMRAQRILNVFICIPTIHLGVGNNQNTTQIKNQHKPKQTTIKNIAIGVD